MHPCIQPLTPREERGLHVAHGALRRHPSMGGEGASIRTWRCGFSEQGEITLLPCVKGRGQDAPSPLQIRAHEAFAS